jgi:hypothetical protein
MNKDHVNSPVKHIGSKVHEAPKEMQMPNCAKAVAFGTVRDELIRQTAYSCYQARNHEGTDALQDWLHAETLVNQMPGKTDLAGVSFQTS